MDYIRTKPLSPDVEMTQQTLEEISALSDQANAGPGCRGHV